MRTFRVFRIVAALPLCTLHSALCTLFMVSSAAAQPGLPSDFTHVVDTIYVISSPVDGGKQVLTKLNSLGELKITVDYIKYNTVVSSPGSDQPFSRYVRVMGVEAGQIPDTGGVGPTISLQMAGCLVLVPKAAPGVNSAPIMKDALGARTAMFSQGNWWYCYARFTKLGQRFTCNPDNSYNGDQPFHPAQNTVIIMGPKREVTINAVIR